MLHPLNAGRDGAVPEAGLLYHFRGGRDGAVPEAGLLLGPLGTLYGTTSGGGLGWGIVFALTPPAPGQTTWRKIAIYWFRGPAHDDGSSPAATLIMDKHGVLYGTTGGGGLGFGTVFALTPPAPGKAYWTEAVLYSFKGGSDGDFPDAGLAMGANGSLYGTTTRGGPCPGGGGCGTVFELTRPGPGKILWTEQVLHSFSGGADGSIPEASLILDSSGNLYGTARWGGNPNFGGTVFELNPPATAKGAWNFQVLYTFGQSSTTDGYAPMASLVMDARGNLYGSTTEGGGSGSQSCPDYEGGCGMVFKLIPPAKGGTAWTEQLLYSFQGPFSSTQDGASPWAALVMGADGVLYGTTPYGGNQDCGPPGGCGTAFSLTPPATGGNPWTETVLYRFDGTAGIYPLGLMMGASGIAYGTTLGGTGTVFALASTTPDVVANLPVSQRVLFVTRQTAR
jgi:hypothetical protein